MIKLRFLRKSVGVVLFTIALILFSIIIFPWIVLWFGGLSMPSAAIPEITFGEYPFRLEYEINGKQYVVEDIILCEYDGIGWNQGQGKIRKWKSYLSSGNERITFFVTNEGKEIYYNLGPAWYYMGNSDGSDYIHSFPNASFVEKNGRFIVRGIIREKELFERYSIRLTNWEFTDPIVNNFGSV